MKKNKFLFKTWLILLFLPLLGILRNNSYSEDFHNSKQSLIKSLLEGIENSQNKIKNILADFEITPLKNEGIPDERLFSGKKKWEVRDWLWERGKVRLTSNKIYKEDSLLFANLGEKSTDYYAFNGEEALYYSKEKLEKTGYVIGEPAYFDFLGTLSPDKLWFSCHSYPNKILIDMLRNKYKDVEAYELKILEGKNILESECYSLSSKLNYVDIDKLGDRVLIKITIDPQHNFLFRELELELLGPIPEYYISIPPYDVMRTYDIEFIEVMPSFYLPRCGKIVFYKKDENGNLIPIDGHKIDITYKGINLPLTKKDFWFPMRSDLPIYNSVYKIRGKNLKEYQQRLAEFHEQFDK